MDTSHSSINSTIELRLQEAAKILKTSETELLTFLHAELGFVADDEGLQLLDAETTTEKVITDILGSTYPKLSALAAGAILKGRDPFKKSQPNNPVINNVTITSNEATQRSDEFSGSIISNQFVELVKALKPVQQWDDKALLENFIATRSEESEIELDRRAKHQKFVVLKNPATKNLKRYEPGQEEIDIETTLKLLKDSRKRTTPGIIPIQGGFAIVYHITALSILDRLIEICPICGETLYEGYCEKCQINFANVGEDERSYVHLISESGKFRKDSLSDRNAILASAIKGIDDLKTTWPSLIQKFDELKLTGNLPKLKIIETRPSSKPADPFHVKN
jgi:hypothetical protein